MEICEGKDGWVWSLGNFGAVENYHNIHILFIVFVYYFVDEWNAKVIGVIYIIGFGYRVKN